MAAALIHTLCLSCCSSSSSCASLQRVKQEVGSFKQHLIIVPRIIIMIIIIIIIIAAPHQPSRASIFMHIHVFSAREKKETILVESLSHCSSSCGAIAYLVPFSLQQARAVLLLPVAAHHHATRLHARHFIATNVLLSPKKNHQETYNARFAHVKETHALVITCARCSWVS